MIEGEERRKERCIISKVFLRRSISERLGREARDNREITCTSLTASYSSASASLSIAVLVRMLLKSKEWRRTMRETDVPERDGIHPLTEVILSILWFLQLRFHCSETVFAILQEAYAFHMGHAFALVVVDAIGEVHLM